MLLYLLINSLICTVIGFAAASFLFRRYATNVNAQEQARQKQMIEWESRLLEFQQELATSNEQLKQAQSELKIKTEAIRTMINRTHHQYVNPVMKRIRGLCELGIMAASRVFNFLELLGKPSHQRYSKLAIKENSETLQSLRLIKSEALTLEEENMNIVKEFEHLQ